MTIAEVRAFLEKLEVNMTDRCAACPGMAMMRNAVKAEMEFKDFKTFIDGLLHDLERTKDSEAPGGT